MFEKFHKIFAWIIVFSVGLICAIIELPIKVVCFITALAFYVFFSITAPLWNNFDMGWCGSFIEWSFTLKFRLALKAMRAYHKALGLKKL